MKLKFVRNLCFVLALTAVAAAQTGFSPFATSQLQLPLQSPPAPSTASLVLSGNPGPQTIYYWIVTNYTVGASSPAGPFIIRTAPNVLSGSNFVQIFPNRPPSSTSVDVLKTLTPAAPSGACACAVATAQTGSVINDQSNSTNAYTVSPLNAAALQLTLQNEGVGAGVSDPVIRQNGVLLVDLALGPSQIAISQITSLGTGIFGPIKLVGSASAPTIFTLATVNPNRIILSDDYTSVNAAGDDFCQIGPGGGAGFGSVSCQGASNSSWRLDGANSGFRVQTPTAALGNGVVFNVGSATWSFTDTNGAFISTAESSPFFKVGGTKFTASGCSNNTTIGGSTAGSYKSGTTGTCTVVLTLNVTATNGFACKASDLTTPADVQNQTATTTTTATISGTTVSGDVISFSCIGY